MRKQQVDHILGVMLESYEDVSDINVTVDRPFQVETAGELKPVSLEILGDQLTPFQTEIIALNMMRNDRKLTKTLLTEGSCDLSYQLAGRARLRVNVFSQKGWFSVAMRQLPSRVPTIEEMRLPPTFYKMTETLNGLILVTGATGTGKTTSLAAFLNEINEKKSVHVVTLEDPVEFVHSQKMSTFNQRELGADFDTFASGLRAALRQAPKIILVGEMRDKETADIALTAAETGHLVLSSLHTVDSGSTINRIIGMFDKEEEKQIRIRLADTIRWIVCQRLLPQIGGGRVAAFEMLGSNLRVRDVILHGETEEKTFYEIIEGSQAFGMMTFDQCIADHYKNGLITKETALAYASQRAALGRAIDTIRAAKGEKTTTIEDLAIDSGYEETFN
ncbi:MAG: PilT/PilU family type 4a pilus ATPase [Deltaproteobacteria bacterium]|nr:MAG: PilT/PilU family type 4a pilus ATPase [Deltaproteobacteria bacterium]